MTARDELQQWVDGVDATHEDGLADLTYDVIPVDLARRVLVEMDEAHSDTSQAQQNTPRPPGLGAGMSDLTTLLAEHHARYNAHRIWCPCGWEAFPAEGTNGLVAHAAHVAEVIERTYAVVDLPEPERFDNGELEWQFATTTSDGIVNLGFLDGGVEMSIAHDLGQSDAGLPTVNEGFIPLSLLRQTAAALLAAANAAEGKTHDHH